ncbi:hypothetical protein [Actinoplanes sichuanensis]|uniref:hypothetical protein n=1 Tax=Actinoplanes sichuanensis TaxID=512349 RepID=UPI0029554AC2|nr:hypothetical protein [Actinoplanes sichuanensis]
MSTDLIPVTVREWTDILARIRFGTVTIAGKTYSAARIKLVAHRLATYADHDGTRIHPGIARLAVDLEIEYRTVRDTLTLLRRLGLLQLVRPAATPTNTASPSPPTCSTATTSKSGPPPTTPGRPRPSATPTAAHPEPAPPPPAREVPRTPHPPPRRVRRTPHRTSKRRTAQGPQGPRNRVARGPQGPSRGVHRTPPPTRTTTQPRPTRSKT